MAALALPATADAGPVANQRLGRHMAWQRGWIRGSWRCLRALWMGESGWDDRALASSGAAGIAEELGHGVVPKTPRGQIRWGLGYIHVRYKGPCRALHAWLARSPHWY